MSPNAGGSGLTVSDIVPSRGRRRQLRTGLEDHITVVTDAGEVTLVPQVRGQPTLGAVRGTPVLLDGQPAGTAADPVIL
jgi:hypothetical protein